MVKIVKDKRQEYLDEDFKVTENIIFDNPTAVGDFLAGGGTAGW